MQAYSRVDDVSGLIGEMDGLSMSGLATAGPHARSSALPAATASVPPAAAANVKYAKAKGNYVPVKGSQLAVTRGEFFTIVDGRNAGTLETVLNRFALKTYLDSDTPTAPPDSKNWWVVKNAAGQEGLIRHVRLPVNSVSLQLAPQWCANSLFLLLGKVPSNYVDMVEGNAADFFV
jgi:hypothetical protein